MANQQKKPIERASDQELRDFAELVLQLDASKATTRSQILAVIGPAWPADFIFVEAAEMDAPAEAQNDEVRAEAQIKLLTGDSRDDPRWIIRIASTELPGGKDPVPVGVNGRVVVIQRGVEVSVPHRYISALRDAVRESMTQNLLTKEMTRSTFTNYPFEVIERPSKDEIEAFRERTKDIPLGGAVEPARIAA